MPIKKKGENCMKKKKSRIPEFNSYIEEANFWDNHSFMDFEDELKNVKVIVDLDEPKKETLILRLQTGFKKQLEQIAKRKGLNVSTLARMWLFEKYQSSKKKFI